MILFLQRSQYNQNELSMILFADLHKMISVTKTDEERLAALHRLCLEVFKHVI